MYRHSKSGDGVIVDLGQPIVNLNGMSQSVTLVHNMTPYHDGQPERSVTFRDHGGGTVGDLDATPLGNALRFGIHLPPVGRNDNMSLSISGQLSYNGTSNGNSISAVPFIAVPGTKSGNDYHYTNISYLPCTAKASNHASINQLVILKDTGAVGVPGGTTGGTLNLKENGVLVGWELHTSADSTVYDIIGSLNARYNYSPIKTLDMEV